MNTAMSHLGTRTPSWARVVLIGALVAAGALTGVHALMVRGGAPPAHEFGLGPRVSGSGLYTATLMPAEPLQLRKLQTVRVVLAAADGQPIRDAQIAVDGGMPLHGHGLPTRPRVTKHVGDGVYEIEGLRFNMRGWWEFTLSVKTDAGTDLVTFNLDL